MPLLNNVASSLFAVLVKVEMVVKVLNYEYTPQLKNKSSETYKALEKNFTDEVTI